MFSTPLICSSSGVATVSATVTGFAPGNWAVTCTEGGTTSGYSEIGSRGIAIRPARKITDEMTPAKIGRSIKNRDKDICDSALCPTVWISYLRCGCAPNWAPLERLVLAVAGDRGLCGRPL